MGAIRIEMAGSFPVAKFDTSAEEGGHANAIQRAIRFLNDKLPAAIELDHKLHDSGDRPPKKDFGKG